MKRFLSVGLLCMSLFTTIQAQTTHTVKHMETQLQDVLNVLEDMDIHITPFRCEPVPRCHISNGNLRG